MKKRLLAVFCLFCVVFSGCNEGKTASKTADKSLLPARTFLVVPYDRTGAQAFVILRFSGDNILAVSPYPSETVFCPEFGWETTFRTLFANGSLTDFSRVKDAFSEMSIPIDRVLSVDVSNADSGFYKALSKTGNNLLFTNPPSFVYTVDTVRQHDTSIALSASQLRRLLSKPAEEFDRPEDYVTLRGLTAVAAFEAGFSAYSEEASTGFSVLLSAGKSTISPTDEPLFIPLFSPPPTILFRPVSGEFVGVGSRKRFYLKTD